MKILLVAEGEELKELKEELKNNKVINANKVDFIDLQGERSLDIYTKIKNKIKQDSFNTLAINIHHLHIKNDISLFYELLLEKVNILDFADLYEEVFDRIPLQNIDASWFFSNLYNKENKFYEKTKRVLDLTITVPAFIISLIFYPIVFIAIKIQDGGKVFYTAERVGRNNKVFKIYKFRSMTDKKVEEIDVASKGEAHRVTRFGNFIRKTRIDELPQLINVLKGELSLIGPRPEFPALVKEYTNQIPFYSIRHTIVPGLSGFAQIYQDHKSVPKFGIATNATKTKLSYDIYYLKHRSTMMDISLIIRTIRILLGKTGL
jgi:lipopolysaccharide/colanic/teichoic acid biosynthesis glycosyltransferase